MREEVDLKYCSKNCSTCFGSSDAEDENGLSVQTGTCKTCSDDFC
jgi:hypothetical protein